MSQFSLNQAMEMAVRHHQAGRRAEAEEIYRQVLAQIPDYPPALHLLGVVAGQAGQPKVAVELIQRAIALFPGDPAYHCNLAGFHIHCLQFVEAVAASRRALELRQDYPEAWVNLGRALHALASLDEAENAYHQALQLRPQDAGTQHCMGIVLKDKKRYAEAAECLRRALTLGRESADTYSSLGHVLTLLGRLDEALEACRQAIRLLPTFGEAHNHLGIALFEQGQLAEATAAFREALRLWPVYPEALNNLGNVLTVTCQPEQAVTVLHEALRLQPSSAEAHSNLGNALKDLGQLEEAVFHLRRAVELRPDWRIANSNLLMTLNYLPGMDQPALYREARQWAARNADPLAPVTVIYENDDTPDRRLRIGFVSADFREHASATFLEPLLAARDPLKMEIYGYSQVLQPDSVTHRLRGLTDHWRTTVGVSDQAMVEMIRNDRIDLLVDLSMHTAGNRLLVFARRPAPVQVTWLAYPGTTGLRAIDYRLTDPYLDLVANDPGHYAEQSVWLPDTFWCYGPPNDAPEVGPLPALTDAACSELSAAPRQVTFGSLNNFCKISPNALQTWAKILLAVPASRLMLHAYEGAHRRKMLEALTAMGVDAAAVEFIPHLSKADYLQAYQRIDIGLDPFPCAGGTTTCDALWMGVPVVTLAGKTAMGRGGVSILSNVGLTDLIAHTESEYVEKAANLARDVHSLQVLRSTLRERMRHSPLMDAPKFTQNMEQAFREMWRKWCASPAS